MQLYAHCTSCGTDSIISSNASTRPDLEQENGESFEVVCSECKTVSTKHVNQIRAKPSNLIIGIGIGIGMIFTAALMLILGAVAVASFVIPIIVWRQQQSSANAFNSYLVR